jgi:cell shape-determining protein MreC
VIQDNQIILNLYEKKIEENMKLRQENKKLKEENEQLKEYKEVTKP